MADDNIKHYEINITKKHTLNADGSLLISGVKLMAEGTWHASNAFVPMRYGETVLKKYADNWSDKSVWSTHDFARSITQKVGGIQNARFQDGACMADVFLHGLTQESKDSITLITHNEIDSISSEIRILDSDYCKKNKVDNAVDIEFVGAALVSKGACEVCKLNKENTKGETNMEDKELYEGLEQTITTLAAKVNEIVIPEVVDMEPFKVELNELKTALESAVQENKELADRLLKLEKEPVQITLANAEPKKDIFNPFK